MNNKYYNSKLLLFGEYTIINGSQALAIPLKEYKGRWQNASSNASKLQLSLPDFAEYLDDLQQRKNLLFSFDSKAFQEELSKGLYFESSIPLGYGLGSSGALCAAIYDTFCTSKIVEKKTEAIQKLKSIFAQMESFFHGSSSGIDPLICYLNESILMQSKNQFELVQLPNTINGASFFLLNTHLPRKTEPLVNHFIESCKNEQYKTLCNDQLNVYNNRAINHLLKANWSSLFETIHQIGAFQYDHFDKMIPESFRKLWATALEKDVYKLKICGAGGGGFIIGFSLDFKKAQKELAAYTIQKVPLCY